MQNQYLVYLAGPIAGLSVKDSNSWRDYASLQLSTLSNGKIQCLNPMRHSTYKEFGTRKEDDILKDKQACKTRDMFDVRRCDLVFLNCSGNIERTSKGSCIEVGWASIIGKPIIAVLDKDGHYDRDVLFSACLDIIFYDLKIGLKRCCDFLLP